MATDNNELLRKAEMALSDLNVGGLMPDAVAKKFIVDTVAKADLLALMRTVRMTAPKQRIPKITITGRVVKPAAEGTAPPAADWTAPTTSEVEITTEEKIAVLPLNDKVVKDNIEGKSLWNTVEKLMQQKIAEDVQELFVLGDTASADADLADFDGMLKLMTSNVVDGLATNWGVDLAEQGMSAMPEKYLSAQEGKMRWLGASSTERKYRLSQTSRATGLGDILLQKKQSMSPLGIPMVKLANWPAAQGSGDKTTQVLLNPKNFVGGWWKEITTEMQRDALARKTYMIWTFRVGCEFEEENATVEVNNITVP